MTGPFCTKRETNPEDWRFTSTDSEGKITGMGKDHQRTRIIATAEVPRRPDSMTIKVL